MNLNELKSEEVELLLNACTRDYTEIIKWLKDYHPDVWDSYRKFKGIKGYVMFA